MSSSNCSKPGFNIPSHDAPNLFDSDNCVASGQISLWDLNTTHYPSSTNNNITVYTHTPHTWTEETEETEDNAEP